MAWTSADLTAVETAIRQIVASGGTLSITVNGRSWSRSNLSELMALRREMQAEVASSNATSDFFLAELGGNSTYQRFGGLR